MRRRMLPPVVLLLALAAAPAAALQVKPKLGPDAVPITARTDYLRTAPAPDYWKLSAFYGPLAGETGGLGWIKLPAAPSAQLPRWPCPA